MSHLRVACALLFAFFFSAPVASGQTKSYLLFSRTFTSHWHTESCRGTGDAFTFNDSLNWMFDFNGGHPDLLRNVGGSWIPDTRSHSFPGYQSYTESLSVTGVVSGEAVYDTPYAHVFWTVNVVTGEYHKRILDEVPDESGLPCLNTIDYDAFAPVLLVECGGGGFVPEGWFFLLGSCPPPCSVVSDRPDVQLDRLGNGGRLLLTVSNQTPEPCTVLIGSNALPDVRITDDAGSLVTVGWTVAPHSQPQIPVNISGPPNWSCEERTELLFFGVFGFGVTSRPSDIPIKWAPQPYVFSSTSLGLFDCPTARHITPQSPYRFGNLSFSNSDANVKK